MPFPKKKTEIISHVRVCLVARKRYIVLNLLHPIVKCVYCTMQKLLYWHWHCRWCRWQILGMDEVCVNIRHIRYMDEVCVNWRMWKVCSMHWMAHHRPPNAECQQIQYKPELNLNKQDPLSSILFLKSFQSWPRVSIDNKMHSNPEKL